MDFQTAVKTCFKKYVDWNGRALRSEYWWWVLFCIIANLVTSMIDTFVLGTGPMDVGLFNPLFSLATLLPSIFVGTRRLHDLGRSGWWQLIAFTVIGILLLLYWYILEGEREANAYGPPAS